MEGLEGERERIRDERIKKKAWLSWAQPDLVMSEFSNTGLL